MSKKHYKNPLWAEDIVSECMADEESRLRTAVANGRFYSVYLLNRCREYFGMEKEKHLNPKKCKGYVGKK
jgi:hypothetical protein